VKILLIVAFVLVYMIQIVFLFIDPEGHDKLNEADMNSSFSAAGVGIFAMILAAIVTSDLISQDLSNNSFVLYFSRALKTSDYLMGKIGGALMVLGLLCALPPILVALVSIATQTGGDYLHSLGVLGRTVIAGIFATVYFIPFGVLMSSLTKKKSYAAVGTFMSFFALSIIAGIFGEFDRSWSVINPIDSLSNSVGWIYGQDIPSAINPGALALFVFCLVAVPVFILYIRIDRKAVGK
jgi:ABC-2 type transport system permease protein